MNLSGRGDKDVAQAADKVGLQMLEGLTEVYREPHFTGYGAKTVVRAGDQARPLAFSDVAVDAAELLK